MAEKHCSSCQPIPVRAVKSLVHPPGCRGQGLKRLEGLQLQILGADYWYTGTVASTGQNLPAPFNVGDS